MKASWLELGNLVTENLRWVLLITAIFLVYTWCLFICESCVTFMMIKYVPFMASTIFRALAI